MNKKQDFDTKVSKEIEKYFIITENEVEKKILKISLELSLLYSFVEHQTYPRPGHPNPEKQKSPYFTLVAILLSLRTTLENEVRAMDEFMKKYSSPESVLSSSDIELSEIIRPAGMPMKKAQTIIRATQYYVQYLLDNLERVKDMPIDSAREKIMKIPWFWPKATDCFLELGMDMPTIVVDVNVLRVTTRIFWLPNADSVSLNNEKQIKTAKLFLEKNIHKDWFLYQIVHTFFLVHWKYICSAKPNCKKCSLVSECAFFTKKLV